MAAQRETCSICRATTQRRSHVAAEQMLGLGGEFRYLECADCGTLSLHDVPEALSSYYPSWYPPFRPVSPDQRESARPKLLTVGINVVLRSRLLSRTASSAAASLQGRDARWFSLLGGLRLTTESAVLDVGCGSGHRLQTLSAHGFRDLAGTDPYVNLDTTRLPGVVLYDDLESTRGRRFDLIMLHHSLEHVEDPAATLRQVRRSLAPSGTALVRIPLAGTYAWRTYGVDWVQLDAPRHRTLFTERSFKLAAQSAGLTVSAVLYDSGAFQIWGSELYRKGLSLAGTGVPDPAWAQIFTAREIRSFDRLARRLNAARDGDQATFALKTAPEQSEATRQDAPRRRAAG